MMDITEKTCCDWWCWFNSLILLMNFLKKIFLSLSFTITSLVALTAILIMLKDPRVKVFEIGDIQPDILNER